AALATEMAEIDLVILGAADRERQIDAQAAILGVDLIRRCTIDAIELLLNLVHLVDVPLVQLVVLLHRARGNSVQLADAREGLRREVLPRHGYSSVRSRRHRAGVARALRRQERNSA